MEQKIQDLIDELRQIATKIQIQGRALTQEEILDVERIYRVLPYLEQALTAAKERRAE